ncbi:MAG TPA: MerR family transcriptional regulator [candidate division Zixibacteria bacterium]|nr:MerR family transcriptional regulator [candidate division Zixibacteria bacterium]
MEAYDSKTASRIVGVSLRQIQYWDERGFIRPSVRLARGRGTRRLYSFHDLICLKVMKDLSRRGLSPQKVRRCLSPLRRYPPAGARETETLRYLTDGEELFVITDDREKILEAMKRRFILSLGIGSLVRDLSLQVRQTAGTARRRRTRPQPCGAKASGAA